MPATRAMGTFSIRNGVGKEVPRVDDTFRERS